MSQADILTVNVAMATRQAFLRGSTKKFARIAQWSQWCADCEKTRCSRECAYMQITIGLPMTNCEALLSLLMSGYVEAKLHLYLCVHYTFTVVRTQH